MQVSASLLCFLLIATAVSIQVPAQADMEHTEEIPLTCCWTLIRSRIPLNYLRDYQLTNDKCPLKAVIFKTRKNRQVCADPKKKWVQDAMDYLDSP